MRAPLAAVDPPFQAPARVRYLLTARPSNRGGTGLRSRMVRMTARMSLQRNIDVTNDAADVGPPGPFSMINPCRVQVSWPAATSLDQPACMDRGASRSHCESACRVLEAITPGTEPLVYRKRSSVLTCVRTITELANRSIELSDHTH